MKKTIMAVFVGMALLAAPAVRACDMDKKDMKTMNETKDPKRAKVAKAGKAGHKTAQKKSETSKI